MHASPSFHYVLFADDTTIVSTHDYLDILLDKTNEELNKLVDWFLLMQKTYYNKLL